MEVPCTGMTWGRKSFSSLEMVPRLERRLEVPLREIEWDDVESRK